MTNDAPNKRFENAIAAIDAANAGDPTGSSLVYSQRMTEWLDRFEPNASEPLKLAARAQHLRRWEVPRNSFPMDRPGYLAWRKSLYGFHATAAAEIMRQVEYDEASIDRVGSLLRKEKLKLDPEMQTLEDVICLVFLENYFAEFRQDKDELKLLNILRRTWAKMSERGRDAALKLSLGPGELELISKALMG